MGQIHLDRQKINMVWPQSFTLSNHMHVHVFCSGQTSYGYKATLSWLWLLCWKKKASYFYWNKQIFKQIEIVRIVFKPFLNFSVDSQNTFTIDFKHKNPLCAYQMLKRIVWKFHLGSGFFLFQFFRVVIVKHVTICLYITQSYLINWFRWSGKKIWKKLWYRVLMLCFGMY